MAHPYASHRQTAVEHSRVGHITKNYAKGGAVKSGKVTHGASAKREMASMEAEGEKSKHRMDKPHRAKGGRVKGNAKTIVNVITGGHPAAGAISSPPPMGIAGPGAMPPPMAAKPSMPMPPPSGPPPMPMRAKGGRVHRENGGEVEETALPPSPFESVKPIKAIKLPKRPSQVPPNRYAKGGHVKKSDGGDVTWDAGSGRGMLEDRKYAGARHQTGNYTGPNRASGGRVNAGTKVFEESKRSGTKVQHNDSGKTDLCPENLDRGKPVTFKSGGRVRSFYARRTESPDGVSPATKMPGGSATGEARLFKEHRQARK